MWRPWPSSRTWTAHRCAVPAWMCRGFSRSCREPWRQRYNAVFHPELLMLYYLIVALYVVVCLILMMVILLQQGKGGDIANAFGGGSSQAAFGARTGATVLSRATTICFVLFIAGALTLSIMGSRGPGSVLGGRGGPAPAPTTPAPVPPAAPATPTVTPTPAQTPAPAPAQ